MQDDIELFTNMLELSNTECYSTVDDLINDASKLKSKEHLQHYKPKCWFSVAKQCKDSRINLTAKQMLAINLLADNLKQKYQNIDKKKSFETIFYLVVDLSYETHRNFQQTLSEIFKKLSNLYKGYLKADH